MPLIPLQIPAGAYRNGTEFSAQNRWRDVNLVRWHEGSLRPVGGWRAWNGADAAGVVRYMHSWEDNSASIRLAVGTYNKIYAFNQGGTKTDITPAGFTAGRVDSSYNASYGGDTYGNGEYGIERQAATDILAATIITLDNWGEYLLAMSPDDGKLYEWNLTGTTMAQVSNAPTSCSGFMVTEERFVVCFGAGGNPRKIQWSDQEDNTDWTAAATNQAGDIELQTSGTILQGVRARGQALILTTEDAHTMTYQGPPFVYGVERVGTACGAISANSAITVDNAVYWMGKRGFFAYSGGAVQSIPCEVGDYVFSEMNADQASKVSVTANSAWNEIWWFYPSDNGTECDRYVAYDYAENIWTTGEIDRTAGVDAGVFSRPLFTESSGEIYEHEIGYDYGSLTPFAETGPILIGTGDQVMRVTNLIPDEKTQGDVTAKFKTRFYPNGAETEYGPFSMSNPTSVRFQGRQVRMRVEGNQPVDWRVGIMRLDASSGGTR